MNIGDSATTSSIILACTKCLKLHPFEQLSGTDQLCKKCSQPSQSLKCLICRSHFRSTYKAQEHCDMCVRHLRHYGKPSTCKYCQIDAAFKNEVCARCENYKQRFGEPAKCDQCKQFCAFDRNLAANKTADQLLCWMCTTSFTRVVSRLKRRKNSNVTAAAIVDDEIDAGKKLNDSISSANESITLSLNDNNDEDVDIDVDVVVQEQQSNNAFLVSDLKDQISCLNLRLQLKDKDLLGKNKVIIELKGQLYEQSQDMNQKLVEAEKLHQLRVDSLNGKIRSLRKQISSLMKQQKKNGSKQNNLDFFF